MGDWTDVAFNSYRYRIRPPTQKELAMKVSKETQKLRDFEAGLLKMYGNFVRVLVRCGGGKAKTR